MGLGDIAELSEFVKASVGVQHVDAAHLRLDLGVGAIQIGQLGRVGLDADGAVADFGDCLVEFGLAAAGDEDAGAFGSEALCRGQADAGTGTGDQCDFVGESHAHVEPFLVALAVGLAARCGC